jgi:uncharacterized protein with HEPN domain
MACWRIYLLQEFETDWQRQWLVERGIEIISEASRHLTDEMKARHSEIAAIGKVLRHNYENIAAPPALAAGHGFTAAHIAS